MEKIKYSDILIDGTVDVTCYISCIGNRTYTVSVTSARNPVISGKINAESFMSYSDAAAWCDRFAAGDANVMIGVASVSKQGCVTVKEIAAAAGMSCRKLAERFGIPYRTMENWSSGVASPPPYVLAMMREILSV